MKRKLIKRIFVALAAATVIILSVLFSGCGLFDGNGGGKDGANGKDLNIYDIYQAAKEQPGNENLTMDEFLKEYLSYSGGELSEQASLKASVNKSLMCSVSIYSVIVEQSGSSRVSQGYFGSGVIIDVDREAGNMTVVTNCHVVYSAKGVFNYGGTRYDGYADDIRLWLYGTEYLDNSAISAQIIATSKTYDIAVLKVEGSELIKNSYAEAAVWAANEEVYLGDTVYAIGNANSSKMSASVGYISKDNEDITVNLGTSAYQDNYEYNVIRITAEINHGNSGGGLFDASGRLIGIVNARSTSSESNMGYALTGSAVRRLVKHMLDDYTGAEKHGVNLTTLGLSAVIKEAYNSGLNADGMAEIREVVAINGVGSGVFGGSVRYGDLVTNVKIVRDGVTVEDVKINRMHNFNDVLIAIEVGDQVTLTIERDGETKEATATVSAAGFSTVA